MSVSLIWSPGGRRIRYWRPEGSDLRAERDWNAVHYLVGGVVAGEVVRQWGQRPASGGLLFRNPLCAPDDGHDLPGRGVVEGVLHGFVAVMARAYRWLIVMLAALAGVWAYKSQVKVPAPGVSVAKTDKKPGARM